MPHIAAAAYYLATGAVVLASSASALLTLAAVEAVMVAGSYLAYQNAKDSAHLDISSGGYLENTQASDAPLPVVYGRYRVGGNRVFVASSGTDNKYLHMAFTLSEGEIDSIEQLYLDDKPASYYGSLVSYSLMNGSASQTALSVGWNHSSWTDCLRHTAYLYVRLEYDPDVFASVPKVTATIKGRKLYDPRTGIVALSDNPALVWYDFMTSKRYGLGLSTSLIDIQSVIDAANWCENGDSGTAQSGASNTITLAPGSSAVDGYYVGKNIVIDSGKGAGQKRRIKAYNGTTKVATVATNWTTVPDGTSTYRASLYNFNGAVSDRRPFLDNLSDILSNFRGDTIWSGGKYKLLIRKYDTPVMSLTEDDVVADSFKLEVPGLSDTPNRVIAHYADEAGTNPADLGWTPREQVIEDNTAVLQYDLEERDTDLPLIGTTNAAQAAGLAMYVLERSRLNRVYTFTAHPRTLALEPGDMIQITHTLPGWANRVVRVMSTSLSQDGLVGLTVQEEDAALYDEVLNLSPHTYFETNLPNPLDVPPEVTNVTFAREEYYNKDVSYTRVAVNFTKPTSPFWDYSEAWVSIDGAGYTHYTDARGGFTIEPVREGGRYKIKMLSVSMQGVRQDFSTATEWPDATGYLAESSNTPPPDVANFRAVPQSDTIILLWDPVNIVDLQGYEIRRGTNWNGGIFIGFTRAVSMHLNGVSPGVHSYMIKSVDTNNIYSSAFQLVTVSVYGPASYTEKLVELNDFQEHPAWAPSVGYVTGDRILPTTPNGFYYQCAATGTSGGVEPSWPTVNGATAGDGGTSWVAFEWHQFVDSETYYDASAGTYELRVIHGGDSFNHDLNLKASGDGPKLSGWNALNTGSAAAIDISPTPTELVLDGDFENASHANWSFFVDPAASATRVFISSGQYAGAYSYQVQITNGGTNKSHIQLYQNNKTIVRGWVYSFTFAAKAAAARTIEIDLMKGVSPYGSYSAEGAQVITLTTGWQVYSVQFTANTDATDARVQVRLGNDNSDVYFDEVSVASSHAGMLKINTSGFHSNVITGGTFDLPFVFKYLTGDFDIRTCIATSNHDSDYEDAFLVARDANASVGEDSISIRSGYSIGWGQLQLLCRNVVNSVNSGDASYLGIDDKYLRMTRTGNVFTLYSKALEVDPWTQRAQWARNDFSSTIQVGLAASNALAPSPYVVQFDYFNVVGGNLAGEYASPVYTRGSLVTRRSWPDFDYFFEGTGSAWYDQFDSTNPMLDQWADVFMAPDTWLDFFGGYAAGTITMEFGYSADGTTWTWVPNFESFTAEARGEYVRYRVRIVDASVEGYLHCRPVTLREAYWK